MSEPAVAIRTLSEPSWYVLRVAAGCEDMVREWLQLVLKAEVRLFKVRMTTRRKLRSLDKYHVETNDIPLFPGYLFVRSDKLDCLRQNSKIIGPIRSGQDFATIRDEAVQAVAEGCAKVVSETDGHIDHVFVPVQADRAIKQGDKYRFLPGSVFGAAVLTVTKVLSSASVQADVLSKSGTKRSVTVSAQTISGALMEAN